MKLEDVEHPDVNYLITDFLKEKELTEYRNFSQVLLKMNDVEFDEYLSRKNWYETK